MEVLRDVRELAGDARAADSRGLLPVVALMHLVGQ